MNYFIEDIKFETASNQTVYALLTLANPEDDFDEMFNVAIFNDKIVAKYQKMLETVNGDVNALPDNKRSFKHAKWVEIPLPKPMWRIWGSEFTDSLGVTHQKNDPILDKNNQPKLYTSFRVLCKETIDNETNERVWANGWGPTERGNSYISSFFISPTVEGSYAAPQMATAPPVTAPVQAPAPQAPQAPVQTAPTQPAAQAPQGQPAAQPPLF